MSADALPHILSPVFAQNAQGKIGPHHLMWPAFWGAKSDGRVRPLPLDTVRQVMPQSDDEEPRKNGWRLLTDESVAVVLEKLAALEGVKGDPVYVAGGKVLERDDEGKPLASQSEAGNPYIWPIAHDVRPAAQSLGSGGCSDCHSPDADFFFGEVPIDSPLDLADSSVEMTTLEDVDRAYTIAFARSMRLRPWLKAITCAASMIVLLLLASYACRGLRRVGLSGH
jgi:hypothetical protein